MNIIKKFEKEEILRLNYNKNIPRFISGDTIKVITKIIDRIIDRDNKEKIVERFQSYEGVVIARSNKGICSSCVVRKISHGEGVERRFMIYSPILHSITLIKRGIVRRAKLYYLRYLSGKAARIQQNIH